MKKNYVEPIFDIMNIEDENFILSVSPPDNGGMVPDYDEPLDNGVFPF